MSTCLPGKPPAERSSLRPMTLMGVDTKILLLDPWIAHLVSVVRKHRGFHNIRRVLNVGSPGLGRSPKLGFGDHFLRGVQPL